MNPLPALPRSPELMSHRDTALLVIDVQQKLLPHVAGHARIAWNIQRLIDGAGILGLPVVASEQYPDGLGPTIDELAKRLGKIPSKRTFSCRSLPEIFAGVQQKGIHKILVVGIEAHVCVQQTALDLITAGYQVYLAVDAMGSRFEVDYRTALQRMDSAGATLTTTESALFEWCDTAARPEFKRISDLVRQAEPF